MIDKYNLYVFSNKNIDFNLIAADNFKQKINKLGFYFKINYHLYDIYNYKSYSFYENIRNYFLYYTGIVIPILSIEIFDRSNNFVHRTLVSKPDLRNFKFPTVNFEISQVKTINNYRNNNLASDALIFLISSHIGVFSWLCKVNNLPSNGVIKKVSLTTPVPIYNISIFGITLFRFCKVKYLF